MGGAFKEMPGERKVIYISAILGIILFMGWWSSRKSGSQSQPGTNADDVDQSAGGGGGGLDVYDPNAEIDAAKEVSLASIAHSAALEFSIATNAISHDLGIKGSNKSGSGGLSIGPFSIGGGGSGTQSEQWDLLTSNEFAAGFSATGLDASEFQMVLQQSAALVNAAQAMQTETYGAGENKIKKYKNDPKPAGAPNGKHLERGADGKYYWVKNGQTLQAA